jgi:hypothetical protein
MDVLIMRGTDILIVSSNATAIPRVGDKIAANGVNITIKDVIWHLDNKTWVEIQI